MARYISESPATFKSAHGSTKDNAIEGFTKRYGVHQLVYYELHGDMVSAIIREKQMKKWNRAWKLEVIEQNPDWKDLWDDII
jgi:putative endonuclease